MDLKAEVAIALSSLKLRTCLFYHYFNSYELVLSRSLTLTIVSNFRCRQRKTCCLGVTYDLEYKFLFINDLINNLLLSHTFRPLVRRIAG